MARQRNPNRLRELVQGAATVFLAKGYRQAQVADVATAIGVAPGTIYLYVESKEALFDLVIRAAIAPEFLANTGDFPIKTPASGSTFEFIKVSLEREVKFPALEKAYGAPARDPKRELETVVRELYRKTSQHWLALQLLERCAADWPALGELWFGDHRLRLLGQLASYLRRRMSARRLRKAPDPAAAARLILELVAAFAMHCRMDPHPGAVAESVAEEVVVDAIVHAYALPEGRRASGLKL
ncbi:MAG: helix-turn-helix transcriptional regulator [Acidobacteria bacterium]|nr:helix-turn-helix transcriptional regulator [Acidobacteriota bacterium]